MNSFTGDDLRAAGYRRHMSDGARRSGEGRFVALWQKRITDEYGTRYFIDIREWDWSSLAGARPGPEFGASVQFRRDERRFTIDFLGSSTDGITMIEETFDEFWHHMEFTHAESDYRNPAPNGDLQKQGGDHVTDTSQDAGVQGADKPSFLPIGDAPWRTPQLVRDHKTPRPGVPEVTCIVPYQVRIPLLLSKLHGEIHEVASDPSDVVEYADVHDVLKELAARCGQNWEAVIDHSKQMVALGAFHVASALLEDVDDEEEAYSVRDEAARKFVLQLHEFTETLAGNLSQIDGFVRILAVLNSLAKLHSISFDAVLAASQAKSERHGGFASGKLWMDTRHVF